MKFCERLPDWGDTEKTGQGEAKPEESGEGFEQLGGIGLIEGVGEGERVGDGEGVGVGEAPLPYPAGNKQPFVFTLRRLWTSNADCPAISFTPGIIAPCGNSPVEVFQRGWVVRTPFW